MILKHLNLAKVGISAIVNFIEMIFWPFRVLENKYYDLFIGTDFSRKVTVKILSKMWLQLHISTFCPIMHNSI